MGKAPEEHTRRYTPTLSGAKPIRWRKGPGAIDSPNPHPLANRHHRIVRVTEIHQEKRRRSGL
jgi:hypothetical protein